MAGHLRALAVLACLFVVPASCGAEAPIFDDTLRFPTATAQSDALLLWKQRLETTASSLPAYPSERFHGRGIVTTAGRRSYFTSVYVTLRVLREYIKTELPIEVFYGGDDELPQDAIDYINQEFGNTRAVDITSFPDVRGVNSKGYQMKAMATLLSSFEHVIWLDSDNLPLRDPEILFDSLLYKQHGAVMWSGRGIR